MLKYLRITIFLSIISQCALIGIKPYQSMKGSEARDYIREELALLTILDASLLTSSDPFFRAAGEYYTTLNLLAPLMIEIDDDAYYSKREVQKCAESIADVGFLLGTDIALFTCRLKPLGMFEFGSSTQRGGGQ